MGWGIWKRSSIRMSPSGFSSTNGLVFSKCLMLTTTAFAPLWERIWSTSLAEKSGRIGTAMHPIDVMPKYTVNQVGQLSPKRAILSPFSKPCSMRKRPMASFACLSAPKVMALSSSRKRRSATLLGWRLAVLSTTDSMVYSVTSFMVRPSLRCKRLMRFFVHGLTFGFCFFPIASSPPPHSTHPWHRR